MRIFLWITQTLGVEYGGAQRIADILRCTGKQRCIENTRQDGVDADALAGEVTRDGDVAGQAVFFRFRQQATRPCRSHLHP